MPLLIAWSGMGVETSGAWLARSTSKEKVSLTLRPARSVAVTCTCRVVTSPSAGVPEKVRVALSKLNQEGRGAPSGVPTSSRAP